MSLPNRSEDEREATEAALLYALKNLIDAFTGWSANNLQMRILEEARDAIRKVEGGDALERNRYR